MSGVEMVDAHADQARPQEGTTADLTKGQDAYNTMCGVLAGIEGWEEAAIHSAQELVGNPIRLSTIDRAHITIAAALESHDQKKFGYITSLQTLSDRLILQQLRGYGVEWETIENNITRWISSQNVAETDTSSEIEKVKRKWDKIRHDKGVHAEDFLLRGLKSRGTITATKRLDTIYHDLEAAMSYANLQGDQDMKEVFGAARVIVHRLKKNGNFYTSAELVAAG